MLGKKESQKESGMSKGTLSSAPSLESILIPPEELTLFKPRLARGGYAEIHAGLWGKQVVAVKQFSAFTAGDDAKELIQEAKIMLQVGAESPYIMPPKKICLDSHSIVMDLMTKGSLRQLLDDKTQALPWLVRYQIACDISCGLRDLHARKILHRDLKSLNILLTHCLRAKLTDFGLAKLKEDLITQSGGSLLGGSVPWMPPELLQLKPGKWTMAADIYSLGMVLWELVTRRVPFADVNPFTLVTWIGAGNQEKIPKDCPPKLKALIISCWDITPSKRPTAIQVISALQPLLANEQKSQTSLPATVMTLSPCTVDTEQLRSKLQSLEKEKRQQVEQHELEMQQLKKEMKKMEEKMAQMELAYKKQLEAAAEEQFKQRIEAASSLSQELKQQKKEIKLSLPPQTPTMPSTISSLTSTSTAHNSQRLMPAPKAAVSAEQLKLQDALILACEHGDEKKVKNCLSQGAKLDVANTAGKYPLGAAVWGMNSKVVSSLLERMRPDSISIMAWEDWEKHNLKHYKELFIVSKFDPQNYKEWHALLEQMDHSIFFRDCHLKIVNQQWPPDPGTSSWSWEDLKKYVAEDRWSLMNKAGFWCYGTNIIVATKKEYETYKIKIQQQIREESLKTVAEFNFSYNTFNDNSTASV
jgi:serine/threonine protein kinase